MNSNNIINEKYFFKIYYCCSNVSNVCMLVFPNTRHKLVRNLKRQWRSKVNTSVSWTKFLGLSTVTDTLKDNNGSRTQKVIVSWIPLEMIVPCKIGCGNSKGSTPNFASHVNPKRAGRGEESSFLRLGTFCFVTIYIVDHANFMKFVYFSSNLSAINILDFWIQAGFCSISSLSQRK